VSDVNIPLRSRVRTALYRFYAADGALLYIGITVNPKARDYQHAAKSPWWPESARKDICWYETWPAAELAERAAIRAERPRYNIAGNAPLPVPPAKPRRTKAGMTPATRARLRAAAETVRRARADLLDAMVEAAQDGATNLDIAKEIDFFYNPDYIGKLVSKRVGKRPPGRRPKRD
jgi:predicted GIY-YIG superfamily endonuclease